MAAIIGSANAQIAVMGHAMVPEMVRRGYNREFATAVTAAGGLMAPIIPPSMLFIIYGVLAQISIGDMFLSGVVPGILMGASFAAVIAVMGFFYNYPREMRKSLREALAAIVDAIPSLSIPVIIIGSIATGVATPTESAALAAVVSLIVGAVFYREFRLENVPTMLVRLVANSSTVLFLVAAANVFGWIIVYERVPQVLAVTLQQLTDSPFLFLLMLNILLLGVGMILDGIAALILVVPILLPIAMSGYGIDPFHFGVVICLNLVIGLMTPPVGTALYIAANVSGCKPMAIMKPFMPFLFASLVVLLLITWEPRLVTSILGRH